MRIGSLFLMGLVVAAASPVLAQSNDDYDSGWYRGEFWSGEYPGGFTVLKDTIVKLRPVLDPKAEKTIDCPLPAKATYQTWNLERVRNDGLHFVSFTEIDEMEVTVAFDATLYGELDATEIVMHFDPGTRWNYLAYFAEGTFLMEYDGVRYTGDQGLIDVSEATRPGQRGYDEWLRINCSTNQWGWLFMGDIKQDDVTFTGPNITGYGEARDAE